jgi:hypothetical protein
MMCLSSYFLNMANNENNQMDPTVQANWQQHFPRAGWWFDVLSNHPLYPPALPANDRQVAQLTGPPPAYPPGYQAQPLIPQHMYCILYLH